MFYGCSSLKYLDFSNFDTSSCQCIRSMFNGCTSITSINLSSFNTSKVTLMEQIFYNCINLVSLDLSSFYIDSLSMIDNLFFRCINLEFLNLEKATISYYKLNVYEDIIKNSEKNIVFCVDESNVSILNKLMEHNTCFTSTNDCTNWKYYQKKIVSELNMCVNSCTSTLYRFEFLGKCYIDCPFGTFSNNFLCYDCLESGKCKEITADDFKNQIIEQITLYLNSPNIINGSNFLAEILSSENINSEEDLQKGISSFDLGNCTNVLKKHYEIPEDENLVILNMDIKKIKNENDITDDNSFELGKSTQLIIYDSLYRKLDLSICKDDIKIFKYIGDADELDFDFAKFFASQGIDIFNVEDDFFSDICHPYDSYGGIDIALNDRKNEIYKNATFCQNGYKYNGVNYNTMAANCICDSEYLSEEYFNMTFESISFQVLKNTFMSGLFNFNLEVLKCHGLAFNKKILVKNIGFYCLLSMLIIQIIFFIIYYRKKLESIYQFILKLSHRKIKKPHKKDNINNDNNKKIDESTISKNKMKSTPPLRRTKTKQINKRDKGINSLLKKSKTISIKNLDNDLKNKLNSPITYDIKKNYELEENNEEKFNEKKKKKLANIDDKNFVHDIKSLKSDFKDKNQLEEHPKNSNELLKRKITKRINKENRKNLLDSLYDVQDMDYEEAIIYDKRGYIKMYCGYLLDTEIILGTFCNNNQLDLFIIKLSFLLFTFQICFFLNALFYTDKYISNVYFNNGILDIVYQLPKSIYSYIATLITTHLLKILSNSKNEFVKLMKGKYKHKTYINLINTKLAKLKNKLLIYFVLVFVFSLFFLYYTTAFCAVYRNSQTYWIIGCLESIGIDSLVSSIFSIFLALFRYISIKRRIKYCYIFTNIISMFI